MSEATEPSCLPHAPTGTSAPTSTVAGWTATSPTGRCGGGRADALCQCGGLC